MGIAKIKSSNAITYNLGDFCILDSDREGIIRYKGTLNHTHLSNEQSILYGIELLNGCVGDSDGTHSGKRYFQTLPNRAIFVEADKIRKVMTDKDHKAPRRLDRRRSRLTIQ